MSFFHVKYHRLLETVLLLAEAALEVLPLQVGIEMTSNVARSVEGPAAIIYFAHICHLHFGLALHGHFEG